MSQSTAESLMPNYFLIGDPNAIVLPLIVDGADLRKLRGDAQALTGKYWSRWVREYLPQLTKCTR